MAIPFVVSRLGVEVNLPTGSTHDILFVQSTEGYPRGQLLFEFSDEPRKITGIQKVAQTFIRTLFTQKGSDVIRYNFGTSFPELTVNANRTTDDSEFIANVNSAIVDAENQTKSFLNGAGLEKASQLDKIIILGYDTTQEALALYLKLLTKAGETASIAIPFPQLDLQLAAE